MRRIIMLRGNSGSGKTTVAKLLQEKLGKNIFLLSQDTIRRDMLRVKDGFGTPAVQLLIHLVEFGYQHYDYVILEGILHSQWYEPLFNRITQLYGTNILAYYFDLSFEETIKRHQTRLQFHEFGTVEMKRWWLEKDYLTSVQEIIIGPNIKADQLINQIMKDLDRQ